MKRDSILFVALLTAAACKPAAQPVDQLPAEQPPATPATAATPAESESAPTIDAGTPETDVSLSGCVTDDDCTVTFLGAGCCYGCAPRPASRRELIVRERDCEKSEEECANRVCGRPEEVIVACVEGECVIRR